MTDQPHVTELAPALISATTGPLSRYDLLRIAALRAASDRVDLDDPARPHMGELGRPRHHDRDEITADVIDVAAAYFTGWLNPPVAHINRGAVLVADQETPGRRTPIRRDHRMDIMTDDQIATYQPRNAVDVKGAVIGPATLTDDLPTDGSAGVATRTDNEDGSTSYSGNEPGVVNLTWTAGDDSLADVLNVTASDAVSISGPDPVITDQ